MVAAAQRRRPRGRDPTGRRRPPDPPVGPREPHRSRSSGGWPGWPGSASCSTAALGRARRIGRQPRAEHGPRRVVGRPPCGVRGRGRRDGVARSVRHARRGSPLASSAAARRPGGCRSAVLAATAAGSLAAFTWWALAYHEGREPAALGWFLARLHGARRGRGHRLGAGLAAGRRGVRRRCRRAWRPPGGRRPAPSDVPPGRRPRCCWRSWRCGLGGLAFDLFSGTRAWVELAGERDRLGAHRAGDRVPRGRRRTRRRGGPGDGPGRGSVRPRRRRSPGTPSPGRSPWPGSPPSPGRSSPTGSPSCWSTASSRWRSCPIPSVGAGTCSGPRTGRSTTARCRRVSSGPPRWSWPPQVACGAPWRRPAPSAWRAARRAVRPPGGAGVVGGGRCGGRRRRDGRRRAGERPRVIARAPGPE